MSFNELVGRKIAKVFIDDEKQTIVFETPEGKKIGFQTEGDCCSNTWIEHINSVSFLIGGTVSEVSDSCGEFKNEEDENDYTCIKIYRAKISTEKGTCDVEYRNSSNGYYGGSVTFGFSPDVDLKELKEDF